MVLIFLFFLPGLLGAGICGLTGIAAPWVGACILGPIGTFFLARVLAD